jgi:hypothetical protein
MIQANKIQQLRFESDTWKRHLVFMAEENIHIKSRLIEILKSGFSNSVLHKAEYIQNSVVEQDAVINLLKNSISAFDRQVYREVYEDGALVDELVAQRQIIEADLESARRRFDVLKKEFNQFALVNG